MISEEVRHLASENLIKTYFCLGLAIPNSTTVTEEGYRACLGEFDHPICNFAAGLRLDPWSTKQLSQLASSRKAFNVYTLPTDVPAHVAELLRRSDFRLSYRLIQMIAEPSGRHSGPVIARADFPDKRLEIARFMTEQFFGRQTENFRKRVACATADAVDLDLYALLSYGRMTGAVMLCQDDLVVGLYNLCVASASRGLGLGKEIAAWALSEAYKQQKVVTLQCAARLQPWYENLGFKPTGMIEVYTLSKSSRGDIMNVI
jgi:hypothetical protein